MMASNKASKTSFVDRENELSTLKALFRETSEGRGTLVFIHGEAGIGKSRLISEFRDFAVSEGALFLSGRGLYGEESSPYLPFIEAMNQYFKQKEGKEEGMPSPGIMGLVSERLDTPMGLVVLDEKADKLDLQTERTRMFETISNLIHDISEDQPLVLTLDDLQWADMGTLRLLHYLARNIRDEKVMIIGAYRPEELQARTEASELTDLLQRMGQEKLFVSMKIERLAPESIEHMVKELLNMEDLPSNFIEKLYGESEGNPYFVEEVVKSLVSDGILEAFTIGEVNLLLEETTIPATIKDVVSRRIGRLDDDAKRIIMMASVIGSSFEFDVLHSASGLDELDVLDALDKLIESGLIREDTMAKEEVYRFDHGQVRAVIYDSLSKSRRRVMHNKIGEVMEEHYKNRLEDVLFSLARHYYIGKNYEKALKYLVMSAKRATKQFALEDSLAYYKTALETLTHLKEKKGIKEIALDLNLKTGKLLFSQGRLQDALTHYRQALKLSEETGQTSKKARSFKEMGHVHKYRGNYAKAVEYFEKALEISSKEDSHFDIADIHRGLGYVHWRSGEFEDAIEHFNQSIANIDRIGDKNLKAITYIDLGNVYNTKGNQDMALDYYTKSIELLEHLGDYVELPRALNNRGDVLLQKQDWDGAIIDLEKAVKASEKSGNRQAKAWALFNVAESYIQKGDFSRAENVLERSYKLCKVLNEKIALHGVYKNYGLLFHKKKEWDKAIQHFEKALKLLNDIKMPYEIGRRSYELALVYKDMGNLGKAKQLLTKAVKIFKDVSARKELEKSKKELENLRASGS